MTERLDPPAPVVAPPYHTPERQALQATARQFATDEVLPVANALDPVKGEIPRSLLDRMAGHGFFGITVDREYGGVGRGALGECMVAGEVGRGWVRGGGNRARGAGSGEQRADPQARA